jgi:hypothetical protein
MNLDQPEHSNGPVDLKKENARLNKMADELYKALETCDFFIREEPCYSLFHFLPTEARGGKVCFECERRNQILRANAKVM